MARHAGVGITVEVAGGLFRIKSVVPGQPACESALMQCGDELLRIEGRDLAGMTAAQVGSLLAGPAGSSVSITARSASSKRKVVCKLERRAAPKAGVDEHLQTSSTPCKTAVQFAAMRQPRGRHSDTDIRRDAGAPSHPSGAAPEKLMELRQELVLAKQQVQYATSAKDHCERAMNTLKARVIELDGELEFERQRGSKWKAVATCIPALECQVHSIAATFAAQKDAVQGALDALGEQGRELEDALLERKEGEQKIVTALVHVERAELEHVRAQAQHAREEMLAMGIITKSLQHELEITRQATAFVRKESAENEQSMMAEHAAKLQETHRLHAEEVERLQRQIVEAGRQDELFRQQKQDDDTRARAEHERVVRELKGRHESALNAVYEEKELLQKQTQEERDALSSHHARNIEELERSHRQLLFDLNKAQKSESADMLRNHEAALAALNQDAAQERLTVEFLRREQLEERVMYEEAQNELASASQLRVEVEAEASALRTTVEVQRQEIRALQEATLSSHVAMEAKCTSHSQQLESLVSSHAREQAQQRSAENKLREEIQAAEIGLQQLRAELGNVLEQEHQLRLREESANYALQRNQWYIHELLRESRFLACELTLILDSLHEAERCYLLPIRLEFEFLLSQISSANRDVTDLMESLSDECVSCLSKFDGMARQVEEYEAKEHAMLIRTAEMECIFKQSQVSALEHEQLRAYADKLMIELTRVTTANMALELAMARMREMTFDSKRSVREEAAKYGAEIESLKQEIASLKERMKLMAQQISEWQLVDESRQHLVALMDVDAKTTRCERDTLQADIVERQHKMDLQIASSMEVVNKTKEFASQIRVQLIAAQEDISMCLISSERLAHKGAWQAWKSFESSFRSPAKAGDPTIVGSSRSPIHYDESMTAHLSPADRDRPHDQPDSAKQFYQRLHEQVIALERQVLDLTAEKLRVARRRPDVTSRDSCLALPASMEVGSLGEQSELEEANRARDELLDTVQLQKQVIIDLHLQISSQIGGDSMTRMNYTPSQDFEEFRNRLDGSHEELEQSLRARDDLLSTVQMQEVELRRLNDKVARESEARKQAEHQTLTEQMHARDLQGAERSLRQQLNILTINLQRTENNLLELEAREMMVIREKEQQDVSMHRMSLELEDQKTAIQEKDIIILQQGEELKKEVVTRRNLMDELGQITVQTALISSLRGEISELQNELSNRETRKSAMLLEMDELAAIAMQMTAKLASYERTEQAAALERRQAKKSARLTIQKLGFSLLLQNAQHKRCMKAEAKQLRALRLRSICACARWHVKHEQAAQLIAFFASWKCRSAYHKDLRLQRASVLDQRSFALRKKMCMVCLGSWVRHTRNVLSSRYMARRRMEHCISIAICEWEHAVMHVKMERAQADLILRCENAERKVENLQVGLESSSLRLAGLACALQHTARGKDRSEADYSRKAQLVHEASRQVSVSLCACDSFTASIDDQLKSFAQLLSMKVLESARQELVLQNSLWESMLQIDTLSEDVTALKLIVEGAVGSISSRVELLTGRFEEVARERRDMADALSDARAQVAALSTALNAEKGRCGKLMLLHEREEKDCADLEHALDETTRRLMETETKHNRVVAWNQELQERLRLVNHINSVGNGPPPL